ncbi:MAG TPA: APC family permease [Sphingomonas sp.]|nr:APC family permease [Sphingomonas sp.]
MGSASVAAAEEAHRDAGLKRGIGTFAFAAAIVNIVVGAGIFTLPAGMAQAAGPYALIAYLVCAIAMGAVVLCCAEAGSRVPTSGGMYGYVEAAFGPLAGFVAGVLLWLSCVLACGGIASALAAVLGEIAPALGQPIPRAAIIIVVIGGLALVNCVSVRASTRLISVMTPIKLVPLVLFIGVGLFFLAPARLHEGAVPDVSGIGRAVILSLFAFQGMETTLGASGEVANPARTLPRALIGAMAFVAALYVAIQVVAQGLLGSALAGSVAPLADGLATIDPRLGLVILIGTAISMGAWIGSDLLGAPRVLFAFARDGFLPRALGKVSLKGQVPVNAILVHAAIAVLLAITGTFEQLAILSVLVGAALYLGACAATWVLRRRAVALVGPPLSLPILWLWVAIGSLSMLAIIAIARPIEIGALVGTVIVSCLLFAFTRAARRRAA